MQTIEIKIPAIPVAQPRQRHRFVKGGGPNGKGFVHNYTPSKHPVQDFKATVRMAFEQAYSGAPLTGPLRCDAEFVMPRPQNMIWKTREMPRAFHAKKPDRDNLDKALMDALKGLAWLDDSQVCQGNVEKWIASGSEQPHVFIRITALDVTATS
jgi:Holliday junction resolvase RusA-like endonuclease